MHQVPAMSFKDNAPSIRYYTPHAQLVVRLPEKDMAGTDIDRLYHWYAGLDGSRTPSEHQLRIEGARPIRWSAR